MNEELEKVLSLLQEGKINKEQASQLIEALKSSPPSSSNETRNSSSRKIRIRVTEKDQQKINLNMPVSWITFGLKFISRDEHFISIGGQSIPIDKDRITDALTDPDFRGTLVDVDKDGSHVEVVIE